LKVEKIIDLDKKKKKIYLDNEESFALYSGEIKKFHLKEGIDIEDSVYQEIYEKLENRAKEYMLYLLKDSDKTEKQIREKLKGNAYPPSVIESVLLFGKNYHYIDDERYARHFLQEKGEQLSRKELEYKLLLKGISREICRTLLKETEETQTQEEAAIERLLRKKNVNFSEITEEKRRKIYAYFMRKGFSYETVLKKVNEFETRGT